MRRDVVGLGIALAVGGLAYSAHRALTPPSSAPPSMASVAAAEPPTPPPARALPVARLRRAHGPPTSIAAHVRRAAHRHRVSESLVAAVIAVESDGNPRAISRRGALGLMQLMPTTAVLLGVRDAFDPEENIDAGVRYLRDLLDRFGNDVPLTLAAYNAGAYAVLRHGGVPPYPETRAFIARVMDRLGRETAPAAVVMAAAPAPPPPIRLAVQLSGARVGPEPEFVAVNLIDADEPAPDRHEARQAPHPPVAVVEAP